MPDKDHMAKVIHLDPDRPRVKDGRDWKERCCRHSHVEGSVREQKLWCQNCGDMLSPVTWIMNEGQRNDSLWHQRAKLKKDILKLGEELKDLKRQIRNAKAQLKRAKR